MKKKTLILLPGLSRFPLAIMLLLCFLSIIFVAMKSPEKEKYDYLALGDSYTIGEKVPAEENFPNQLVRIMREKGKNFSAPRIIATTGWTTGELQAAVTKARIRKKYDFVTLLIGVNNQYRGLKVVDYIPEFEKLLQQAIHFAGNDTSHVVVLSIPDWGVTPFAEGRDRQQIAKDIDAYNAANRLITEKYGIHYIDITPGTRKASSDASLLAEDGLHPSGKAYGEWAAEIGKYILPKTKK
ncbi:SGNH/GDSL hydrolase family protein [Terrimonas sp. NA20]|uniref:SGNH/GDSL hydrolase family protein n=1 Tax=Terrimonas ginsenosidimutans TaxID=2908004 RepID=A0ABS9KYT2_9BACT|nr:SGNH/GDSL hydrolase family protein [Terrimonas ginsenosidimutans]MCG2617475.1 SGNH/GDSL hydrolase family protein [Terrimonas ginsenosidimutans]